MSRKVRYSVDDKTPSNWISVSNPIEAVQDLVNGITSSIKIQVDDGGVFSGWSNAVNVTPEEEVFVDEVNAISQELTIFDDSNTSNLLWRSYDESAHSSLIAPMEAYLTKKRFWVEDKIIESIIRLVGSFSGTTIEIQVTNNADSAVVYTKSFTPSQKNTAVRFSIPNELTNGGSANFQVVWKDGGTTLASHNEQFTTEVNNPQISLTHVPINIPNPDGVTANNAPFLVGVPLPRGAVYNTNNFRLEDNSGNEIPCQVTERARWSKYGSLKWVHVDFTTSLSGASKDLKLQYGSGVSRTLSSNIVTNSTTGFPLVEAGFIKLDENGLWIDADGQGTYEKVLTAEGLRGGFVERTDGSVYQMLQNNNYVIEEVGPEKVVIRRGGQPESGNEEWYNNGTSDFCQFLTRYIIYKDSPVVKIMHTWFYTGDGNASADQINNMGWKFDFDTGYSGQGILTDFNGSFQANNNLLQSDHNSAALDGSAVAGGRSVGGYKIGNTSGVRTYFGTKDFWQNYPNELEFSGNALMFYNFPKTTTSLGDSYTGYSGAVRNNIAHVRWAHGGSKLNFRMPVDLEANSTAWGDATDNGRGSSLDWIDGVAESINAQGISRTEEMWLYMSNGDDDAHATSLLKALNDNTLTAVVDPQWMYESQAVTGIPPKDDVNYPEEEDSYTEFSLQLRRWRERLGTYGKWIYGDSVIYNETVDGLKESAPISLYRAVRKRHQGYPYNWKPYMRSGDFRFLKEADIATRHNIDVNFCHYVSAGVRNTYEDYGTPSERHRKRGIVHRGSMPWVCPRGTTTRHYEAKVDFLLNSWYLTGYHRAKDYIETWMELVKQEDVGDVHRETVDFDDSRHPQVLHESLLKVYEAMGHDEWFMDGAYQFAKGRKAYNLGVTRWRPAELYHYEYSGDEGLGNLIRESTDLTETPFAVKDWSNLEVPTIYHFLGSYKNTNNSRYLRYALGKLDWFTKTIYKGSEETFKGIMTSGHRDAPSTSFGFLLDQIPLAMQIQRDHSSSNLSPIYSPYSTDNPVDIYFNVIAGDPALSGDRVSARLLYGPIRNNGSTRSNYDITGPMNYQVTDPNGSIANTNIGSPDGAWDPNTINNGAFAIKDISPDGTYKLSFDDPNQPKGITFPLFEDDVKTVIVFPSTGDIGWSHFRNQGWFFVPNGMTDLTITIRYGREEGRARRCSLYDPDGVVVRDDHTYLRTTDLTWNLTGIDPAKQGRLWRLVLPHQDSDLRKAFSSSFIGDGGTRFSLSSNSAPASDMWRRIFALHDYQWFDPTGNFTV